jgi:hypothetical protein
VNEERNGNQPGTAHNLPVIPAAPDARPPAVAQPPRPPRPNPGQAPALDGQPDLAEQDRRSRWEWQARSQLIAADHQLKARVKHPDGGDRTVEDTMRDEDEQRTVINDQMSRGSHKHRRLASWIRSIPKLVLVFDFCLLLFFFGGITNVDWSSPLSANLIFAVALDAMVTVLSYGFLSYTGHRMRSYKTHAGTLHLSDMDGFTKAAFGIALAVMTALAVMMFIRMRAEVLGAIGVHGGVTLLVVPLAVAAVSAVANYLVVAIHAHDGSDEVARLDRLAAATRRPASRAHRLRERASQQASR